MFEEGNLLLFEPFKFEDGSSKRKFFIVLKNNDGVSLLASLPTSKDHIPADLNVHAGCYEYPDRGVNVYVFMANTEIATNLPAGTNFSFEKNTFVYGANLATYPVSSFVEQQLNGETKIRVIGQIKEDVFNDLIQCLKNSALVKNKFKRFL